MTARELNRDIKRLYDKLSKLYHQNLANDEYYRLIDEDMRYEFMRLYRADDRAEYLNLKSLKMMIKINHRHRYVSSHQFYLNVTI